VDVASGNVLAPPAHGPTSEGWRAQNALSQQGERFPNAKGVRRPEATLHSPALPTSAMSRITGDGIWGYQR